VPVARLIGRVFREDRIYGCQTGGAVGVEVRQSEVKRRDHGTAEVAVVEGMGSDR
jgi:hypothetical protein